MFCLLAVSCTVTKRHYRKGFHVQWHHALPERVGNSDETAAEAGAAAGFEEPGTAAEEQMFLAYADLLAPSLLEFEDPAFQSKNLPQQQAIDNPVVAQSSSPVQKIQEDHLMRHHTVLPVQPYLFSPQVEVPGQQEANHSMLFGILALCLFVFLFFPAVIFGIPAIESGRLARDRNRDRDAQVTKRARVGMALGSIALCLVFAVLLAGFIGLVCGFFAVYASAEAAILSLTFLCIGAFVVGILLALMTWAMIKYVF